MSQSPKKDQVMLARFEDPHDLLEAAVKVRDEGYIRYDCHSPFPIHGMDDAMGLKRSPIGYVVGIFGTMGLIGGMTIQWWTSSVDYPLVISGKPFFSWQAFIPVTFALTVLMAAFGALFGMLFFNRLPQLYHRIFDSDRFAKVTNDGFFVCVEGDDEKFDPESTRAFLDSIGGKDIELVSGK